jgi:transposase
MQLVNMVTELSNHVRGVLKVFGLVVEGARGGVFADRVEALAADRPEVAAVVRPMLEAWRGCGGRWPPTTSRCAPRPRCGTRRGC